MASKLATRRGYLLPLAVGVIGIALSVTFWRHLLTERRQQLLQATVEAAVQTEEVLELGLVRQMEILRGLRDLWSTFDLRPMPEWRADVNARVDRIAGLESLAWVDLDEPRKRIAAGTEQSPEELQIDVEEARRHFEQPYLAPPAPGSARPSEYRVFLPVRTPDDHAGVLVAHLDARSFLEYSLRARPAYYAVSVRWDDTEVFSRGEPSRDPSTSWWEVADSVELPLSGQWHVTHRPTPELVALRLNKTPHYLLGFGIALSIALTLAAHQFRTISRQARSLTATNRALEARVAERTRDLQTVIADLETFNYSVSHDLRSPLSAILNFVAVLREDYRERPLDSGGVAMLDRVGQSARRAADLLEDLLQLSRAGRAPLSPEQIDMAAVARECFAQVRESEGGADVDFGVDTLPVVVGDRDLLRNVFANLFSNAIKYSRHRDRPQIRVTGRVEDDECVYEVADNGTGFDMQFVDKVFGLFERLHSQEQVPGTGIGLAIVVRIVKRHGGRTWAESSPGAGARFYFSIPHGEAAA